MRNTLRPVYSSTTTRVACTTITRCGLKGWRRTRRSTRPAREPDYPNRFGSVFVGFAVLLVSYVLLLIAGPAYDSPEGIMVQAIGQKTIVYASVISIFIQAYGAKKLAGESLGTS